MRTKLNIRIKQAASALIISLFIMAILAFSIAGYMDYATQQSVLGTRAQSWNAAMAVAEAGIEEGLQALNVGMSSTANWTHDGDNYTLTRTLPNGCWYTVTNNLQDVINPVITSCGNVPIYHITRSTPSILFATVGVNASGASVTNLTRTVQVAAYNGSLYLAAMVARRKIDMNGNGVTTDSFDSSNTNRSNHGFYDPSNPFDNGDVASNEGIANAVSVGNANIYGHVYTGPGGSVDIGSQGGVGTHAWQSANGSTPQDGYVLNTANFSFPDTSIPYTSGMDPGPCSIITISGTNTTHISYTNMANPPGRLSTWQTLGPVTTNCATTTTNGYPGAVGGLVTNAPVYVTTNVYPGAVAGLVSNCSSYITVTNYPGSGVSCLSTNCSSYQDRICGFPSSYCQSGGVVTNINGNGSGCNTRYSYYANSTYTYASVVTYTYPTYSYSFVVCTYSYDIFFGTPIYQTNSYDHCLSSGDYYATSLSGSTYVSGTARLVLPNGLNMSSGDSIIIGPSGSLKLYSGGSSVSIGGNGVANQHGYAANFILYAPDATDFDLNGNGTFTGVLVAPNANVRMNGGGNNIYDFIGALMAGSVTMNGHFNFHYDEALGHMSGTGRFLIQSWKEL